jgi:anti-sigma B factor antagonist
VSDERILAIASSAVDGVDVVRVTGEVDLTNAEEVRQAVEATTTVSVVLDLTEVAYLDSSGLRAIDRCHRHLVSDQRALLIVSPPETASDWTLRVAGFDRSLVLDSLDAALASAAAPAGS